MSSVAVTINTKSPSESINLVNRTAVSKRAVTTIFLTAFVCVTVVSYEVTNFALSTSTSSSRKVASSFDPITTEHIPSRTNLYEVREQFGSVRRKLTVLSDPNTFNGEVVQRKDLDLQHLRKELDTVGELDQEVMYYLERLADDGSVDETTPHLIRGANDLDGTKNSNIRELDQEVMYWLKRLATSQ